MNFYKIEEFLDEIVSYVKFAFDRDEIRLELKDHMMDKIEYYMESGYDWEEAEKFVIKDMGDPKEIGIELDKQHNPIIGWIWRVSHIALVLFMIINTFIIGSIGLITIFIPNKVRSIPKENIVYRIDLDEKIEIDNRVIKITNVIYEKDGDMNIFYKNYEKGLRSGWSGGIGTVTDDLGTEYNAYSASSSGGLIRKSMRTIKDFSQDASSLIIDYDQFNRKYRVEIPLKTGENND